MRTRGRCYKGSGAIRAVAIATGLTVAVIGCASSAKAFALWPKASQQGKSDSAAVATIERIDVSSSGRRITIRAIADRPLLYSAIRQEQPSALVLNITATRIAKPIEPIQVQSALVDTVFASQASSGSPASRLVVMLKAGASYEVHARPNGLEINVSEKPAADDVASAAPAGLATDIDETDLLAEDQTGALLAKLSKKPAEAPAPKSQKSETKIEAKAEPKQPMPVLVKAEETPIGRTLSPAKALTGVRVNKEADGTEVTLDLDGSIEKIDTVEIDHPSRLVVDLWGVVDVTGKKEIPVSSSEIARVRIGRHPDKVRVVLDLSGGKAPFSLERDGKAVVVAVGERSKTLASRISGKKTTDVSRPVAPVPVKIVAKAETPSRKANSATEGRPLPILADLDSAGTVPAEDTPVQKAKPTSEAKPAPAMADLQPAETVFSEATPTLAALDASKAAAPETGSDAMDANSQAPEISMGFRPGKVYTGRLLSLDFKDADVQNILRLIAEVSQLNVVAGDDVTGKVTVRLVNVPWDQALDIVLASRNMGYIRSGNIIRVAPADRLKAEEAQLLADRRSKEKLEDLEVRLQPVNYAKASDVRPQVESLLSDRGSVNIDTRTNTLIIKDIPTVINQAVSLVRKLDTQTPQVLIEAKIVEANLDFSKQLGISYTADFLNPDIANGTNASRRNLAFGNRVVNSGTSTTGSSLFSGALPITGTPTGVAAASFTALKDALDIDVVIQALESSGHGRVISSPRITTLDNKEARIEQGISIPFQTTSQGDTNLTFIDANLSLTVTPHVTSDNSIIMKIKVARNAPDTSVPTSTGDPAIAKNEAVTETLVKDGETIVIGGIYVIDKSVSHDSIPYLNRIPGVQFLFRNYIAKDNKKELIIFVTPRIVGRETPA